MTHDDDHNLIGDDLANILLAGATDDDELARMFLDNIRDPFVELVLEAISDQPDCGHDGVSVELLRALRDPSNEAAQRLARSTSINSPASRISRPNPTDDSKGWEPGHLGLDPRAERTNSAQDSNPV